MQRFVKLGSYDTYPQYTLHHVPPIPSLGLRGFEDARPRRSPCANQPIPGVALQIFEGHRFYGCWARRNSDGMAMAQNSHHCENGIHVLLSEYPTERL